MDDVPELAAFTDEDITALLNDDTFLGVGRYHAHEQPKAILLAGQPGAGKTELSSMMTLALGGDAAFINGDDFRRYHPNYRKLFSLYGSDAVSLISPFSNAVVERMIDQFSDRRFHLVIEGTGRTTEVPRSTAERLSRKGYTVELAVIATRPEISLISLRGLPPLWEAAYLCYSAAISEGVTSRPYSCRPSPAPGGRPACGPERCASPGVAAGACGRFGAHWGRS